MSDSQTKRSVDLEQAKTTPFRVRGASKEDRDLTPPDKLEFIVPTPPSANAYWRPLIIKGRPAIGRTNEANKYKRIIKEQFASWPYFPYPRSQKLHASMVVYLPSLRGDVHNIPKILWDSLEGIVIENDISIVSMEVRLGGVMKENPIVEVCIETL